MNLLKNSLIALGLIASSFAVVAQSVSFDDLDINDDGVISTVEAQYVLTEENFAEMDADQNGEITQEEFDAKAE